MCVVQSLSKALSIPTIFRTIGSFLEVDELQTLSTVNVTARDFAMYTLYSRTLTAQSEVITRFELHIKIQKLQKKYNDVNLRLLWTPDRFTQHEAYLSKVSFECIKKALDIDPAPYKNLIKKIDKVERSYPNCFSLLHAQDITFKIMYDLRKALYEESHACTVNNFEFIRDESDYASLEITKSLIAEPSEFDLFESIRNILLSTNFTLPGWLDSGESTLSFLHYQEDRVASRYPDMLKRIVSECVGNRVELQDLFVAELLSLNMSIKSDPKACQGLLLQVLIPKYFSDLISYVSKEYGRKYGEKIEGIDEGWIEEKEHYTKISQIFDAYRNNPEKLEKYFGRIQARVVLSKEFFASPDNGIEMITHHLLSKEVIDAYAKRFKEIFTLLLEAKQIIVSDKQEQNEKLSELETKLQKKIFGRLKENVLLSEYEFRFIEKQIEKKTLGRADKVHFLLPCILYHMEAHPDNLQIYRKLIEILFSEKIGIDEMLGIIRNPMSTFSSLSFALAICRISIESFCYSDEVNSVILQSIIESPVDVLITKANNLLEKLIRCNRAGGLPAKIVEQLASDPLKIQYALKSLHILAKNSLCREAIRAAITPFVDTYLGAKEIMKLCSDE